MEQRRNRWQTFGLPETGNGWQSAIIIPSSHPTDGEAMPGPFIFIATNRLKPGKLADERRRVPDVVDFIQANEPRLLAFNEYANAEGTEGRRRSDSPRRRLDGLPHGTHRRARRKRLRRDNRVDHEHPGLRR